jgi:hypothetical protein
MTNFTKQIENVETGEINIVELSDEEQSAVIAERESYTRIKLEKRAEAAAKKATAEAKLAALGLTAEDLKALGL